MGNAVVKDSEIAGDKLAFFLWGGIAGRVLITNDGGDWMFLDAPEFDDLLAGRIDEGHPRFDELLQKGFVRNGLDLDALAARLGRRIKHAGRGPFLHVIDVAGGDLPAPVASRIADLALESTSPGVTFEFRCTSGDPAARIAGIREFVELVDSRNKRAAGKVLTFRLATDFRSMTEEAAEWLIDAEVQIVTRLDGPADLHDANLAFRPGSRFADVERWIGYFHRRYDELNRHPGAVRVEALPLLTRGSLGRGAEIVGAYRALGLRGIQLRPLLSTDLPASAYAACSYSIADYLKFYEATLEAILAENRKGGDFVERTASFFLAKILWPDDPSIVDLQSPCGAGSSYLSYDHQGRVYAGEDGLRLAQQGDGLFVLGDIMALSLAKLVAHPTVRAIAAASLLDSQPMCADCWNKPFCGVWPTHTYATQGDLFGQRPRSPLCQEHMGVSQRLFERLAPGGDPAVLPIFNAWAGSTQGMAGARWSIGVP